MTMVRTGRFPLGYFVVLVIIAILAGYGYAAYGQLIGGHPPVIDEAVVVEPQPDLGPPVDPRYVEAERSSPATANPDRRLDNAAGNAGPGTPPGTYAEFVDAMTEHPYVERVFRARYARDLAANPGYARYGLRAFRQHYRETIPHITPPDQLPIYGCLVAKELERVMDGVFGDPARKAQLDEDVRAALQAAAGFDEMVPSPRPRTIMPSE